MNQKKVHTVKLSDQDLYWLQHLLEKFIVDDANLAQIDDCYPLLKELKTVKNMGLKD